MAVPLQQITFNDQAKIKTSSAYLQQKFEVSNRTTVFLGVYY
jgi:hypothetical protein